MIHANKSSPKLMLAEAQVLTPVQGGAVDSNYKAQFVEMANDFYKINDILLKYEDDILNLKVTPTEGDDVTQGINDIFVKIEDIASNLGDGTAGLLPAVQRLIGTGGFADGSNEGSILGDLSGLAGQMKIAPFPDFEADVVAKMAGDYYKLGEVAIDYKLELILGVPPQVAQKQAQSKENEEYIKIKIEDVFVSSYISETDQSDLDQTLDGAINLVNGVINPSTPSIGPTIPTVAGDTIT